MKHHIGLRQINQRLAEYIEAAEKGDEVIITRRGKPIVKLSAVSSKREFTQEQQAAWERILTRMKKGYSLGIGKFDRESIYRR